MVPPRILILDYGMGNLRSVHHAVRLAGADAFVSSRSQEFPDADAFVLPGVGTFAEGMRNLLALDVVGPLERELSKKKPLLGICLGMQLLAEDSDEHGLHRGLGWIPGHVRRLPADGERPIPHMGWNSLAIHEKEPLFEGLGEAPAFYFVHSYAFECPQEYCCASFEYGQRRAAAVQKELIYGVQFHPEKSGEDGLQLLRNFVLRTPAGARRSTS